MPNVEKLNIALPAEMAAVVRQAVETGEYASDSDAIRDAVTDWMQKRTRREQSLVDMRRRWMEAVADDSDGLDPDEVFDRLERKYDSAAGSIGH
jgi:antitoxin ParD1/3/4